MAARDSGLTIIIPMGKKRPWGGPVAGLHFNADHDGIEFTFFSVMGRLRMRLPVVWKHVRDAYTSRLQYLRATEAKERP